MSIELSEAARQVIDQLVAQGKYASVEEAVNALITRSVPRSFFDDRSEEEIVAAQKAAMKELLEEIKDMSDGVNGQQACTDEDLATKAARQKEAGKKLLEKLKSMPPEPTPDGKAFSGRDHDKILYGGDW